jgi:GTP-binding protein
VADANEEAGRLLFAQACHFVAGAARDEQLPPPSLPEVAFAGRSNVGKSSLVNALTGRRTLARVSSTPGRTRQINFFDLGGRLMLVDLPGYGYARAAKGEIKAWTGLVRSFLRGRGGLRRVCLLIDSRHGPKPADEDVMALLDEAAVVYQVVLTKCDKPGPEKAAAMANGIVRDLASRHPALYPQAIATSARAGLGIEGLRAELATLADPPPDKLAEPYLS